MSSYRNRLKELRESLGYSVDEFAKIIGVHRSSIYRYEGTNEAEPRDMPISLAIQIAEKFKSQYFINTKKIKPCSGFYFCFVKNLSASGHSFASASKNDWITPGLAVLSIFLYAATISSGNVPVVLYISLIAIAASAPSFFVGHG